MPPLHPTAAPAILSAQEAAVPAPLLETPAQTSAMARLIALFPPGQFLRYLATGLWNTLFGFSTYALFVSLLAHALPSRVLPLTALLASVVSTPLNITMAFFGYKFLVFRTRGNFLAEWLRCFAVYGTSIIPSLLALSALTRLFQSVLRTHPTLLPAAAQGSNTAAYLAGALLMLFTTVFSFIGHKTFSFRAPRTSTPPPNTA